MKISKRRPGLLLTLFVGAAALFVIGILGFWVFIAATATPLHPDPDAIPSKFAATPPSRWSSAVNVAQKLVRAAISEQNLPGLSVAVGIDNELVWTEGFGWADLESKSPVLPDTCFRIGTASTMLTSAAVGLLLESGQLQLDAPIRTYVPEFPEKQWPVTLRHFMAHTSGLRSDAGDEGPLYGADYQRPVEAFSAFANKPLLFEPGTEFRFSAFGWIVVSAAIEAAQERPFHEFMREQVFQPLRMTGTTVDPAATAKSTRATSYFPRFAADPNYGPDEMRDVHLSGYAGAGSFVSTASDLVHFGLALCNGQLLQPTTVQLLQTQQKLASGHETNYGLGWEIESVTLLGKPTRVVGHNGDVLGGSVSTLIVLPEQKVVVAVLCNISYADTRALALRIGERFAN